MRYSNWRIFSLVLAGMLLGIAIGITLVSANAHTPCDDEDCYYQYQCDTQGQCEYMLVCNG